jgi:Fic family protein
MIFNGNSLLNMYYKRVYLPIQIPMKHNIKDLLIKIHEQKKTLDKMRPFNKAQLKNLREWFRIWFIHHSNAIEGNTLSLQEVKIVLEEGITIGGKTVRELQETMNHGEIMTMLHDFFDKKPIKITESQVLKLHTVLLQGLLEKKQLGKYREIQVYISWSTEKLPQPSKVQWLMKIFFQHAKKIKTLKDVAKLHYDMVKIHPFVDGNGRIARVIMNLALVGLWYFPIIIPKVIRAQYIQSLSDKKTFEDRYGFFLWQIYENHKDYVRFFTNK